MTIIKYSAKMPKRSGLTNDSPNNSELVPAVSVRDVSVAYSGVNVLEGATFEVAQGEIAAIIGPNGSGKTTLMRAILGLSPMSSGEVRIFGKHLHTVRDLIGYVPQRFDFDRDFPITVREFLELGRHPHSPISRIAHKTKEVGLAHRVLDQRLGSLSGGQMQRVLIAQAILNEPSILFLDEPTAGVDVMGEATLYDIIQHLNSTHRVTVLMVSHDIATVSDFVNNVICVNKKMLCYGPPRSALTLHKMQEVFGPDQKGFYTHEHKDHSHAPGEKHKDTD